MSLNMYGALRIALWVVAMVSIFVVTILLKNEYGLNATSLSHSDFPANWIEDPSVTLTIKEIEKIAGEIEVASPTWVFWKDTATRSQIQTYTQFVIFFLYFAIIMFTMYIEMCLQERREGSM